jgi:hypothetical protein
MKKYKAKSNKTPSSAKNSWYQNWQKNPYRDIIHWIILAMVALGIFLGLRPLVLAVTDIVKPTVSITYPSNKIQVKPNTQMTVMAKASDDVGVASVGISIMRWNKINGNSGTITTLKHCEVTAPPYSCAWTVPSDRNVEYMVQAVAYDTSGNFSISRYVQFPVR